MKWFGHGWKIQDEEEEKMEKARGDMFRFIIALMLLTACVLGLSLLGGCYRGRYFEESYNTNDKYWEATPAYEHETGGDLR